MRGSLQDASGANGMSILQWTVLVEVLVDVVVVDLLVSVAAVAVAAGAGRVCSNEL